MRLLISAIYLAVFFKYSKTLNISGELNGNNFYSVAPDWTFRNRCMNLNCSRGYVYLLDKTMNKQDNFYIDGDTLYFDGGIELPPTHYCAGMMPYPNETDHEVALVCCESDIEEVGPLSGVILRTMQFCSVVFLVFTVVVYVLPAEMRDMQGHCTAHFLINYTLAYFVINIQYKQDYTFDFGILNISKAQLLYFFTLCSFCWLNTVVFNVWKILTCWSTKFTTTYVAYASYSYGLPIVLVCFSSLVPQYAEDTTYFCFNDILNDYRFKFRLFYMPIIVLLIMNVVLMADSYRRLKNVLPNIAIIRRCSEKLLLRFRYIFYLHTKLFVIIASVWTMEIICASFLKQDKYAFAFVIKDILNSTQGILIFLVLIVFRTKVLRIISSSKLCGVTCSAIDWSPVHDCEEDEEFSHLHNGHYSRCENDFSRVSILSKQTGSTSIV